jgi:hypothetical protein
MYSKPISFVKKIMLKNNFPKIYIETSEISNCENQPRKSAIKTNYSQIVENCQA